MKIGDKKIIEVYKDKSYYNNPIKPMKIGDKKIIEVYKDNRGKKKWRN